MIQESISVFDIFKIGIGPSSSHTMGPWRAAQRFLTTIDEIHSVESVEVHLYGSLAKTGKGHGTDVAVQLGLMDCDPEHIDPTDLPSAIEAIQSRSELNLSGKKAVPFDPDRDIHFHRDRALPFHPNGVAFCARTNQGRTHEETYYSVGGGFVVQEGERPSGSRSQPLPFPIASSDELVAHCQRQSLSIPEIVRRNEESWRTPSEVRSGLARIWQEMQASVYRGCHAEGQLPGGLEVRRRASDWNNRLLFGPNAQTPASVQEWITAVRASSGDFESVLKWVSCFAIAVNEENAAFGRVVTAPTNGAAGVIPAVLMYYLCFVRPANEPEAIESFLLTAGELGSLFKKGATISAAMGGCQAEIGVSSAMAAGALCQVLGGSVDRVLMAAEIAMEHHLGLTCDPIGGLVQIPCIERNTMGAMKAITAANIAMQSDPDSAKVTLDEVIRTMWQTAQDMNVKYKETSEGGLAVNVPVVVPEC